jgi:clan AA aspartic protease (TIGR02281 family)
MDYFAQTLNRAFNLILAVAFLAGCAPVAQRQYQTAIRNQSSEECRDLQSVLDERERYRIVARSPELEEDALRRCGLPHSGGGGPPFQTGSGLEHPSRQLPLNSVTDEVKIEKRGNTYRVPVRINQTITLPFLLDTGATDLVIPADVALTLIRAGALTSNDFIGKSRYSLANGSEEVSDRMIIREVQVGEHAVRNVTASISPPQGEPLLGQSFLSKFGAVTLDYKRLVLILSH